MRTKITAAGRASRLRLRAPLACLGASACLLAGAASAQAAPEITSFEAGLTNLQAGGHPDAHTEFTLATEPAPGPQGEPGHECGTSDGHCEVVKGGAPKEVAVELPKGLFGNPQAIPQCTVNLLAGSSCPPASQVGALRLDFLIGGAPTGLPTEPFGTYQDAAVYNLVPERGEVAKLGMKVVAGVLSQYITIVVRNNGDYGLTAKSHNLFDGNPLVGLDLTLWGSPLDPSHDPQRQCFADPGTFGCSLGAGQVLKPFLVAPQQCGVDGSATLKVDSYQAPGVYAEETSVPQQVTGCDQLTFNPAFSAQPDTTSAASPSGLNVHLSIPQHFDSLTGLETPPLKDATVILPEGVSISPTLANGLVACSDAQLGIGTENLGACPPASKIGTATLTTPVLSETLSGAIYVGSQQSSDPTSGNMYRIFLELRDEDRGLDIKLPGHLFVNPNTGRVEARFTENPQLPFSDLELNFKGGPNSPLTTPKACGTYQTEYTLTSWGGQSVSGSDPMTIDRNCATGGFTPSLEAGGTNPVAGKSSPFTLKVTREDGQQNVKSIQATLPEGELAKLAGVPLCADAAAATGACDASSQIGTTTIGVGAGSNPLYVPQPGKSPTAIYLAGPYKSAPYSLVFKVPAQAGPFDLGTIAVRAAIYVNPETAVVTAKSDPLPQILAGVPIRYRTIYVNVNRDGFIQTPTSCDPMAVSSTITSDQGKTANPQSRFQVGSCERLAFKPKLALSVKGKTRRGAYQRFKAVLSQPKGQANIGKVSVALPHSEFLAQNHINTICTRVQFNADACPKGSIYGKARAFTPLLDQPLEGPVYLRANGGERELPDLVAALHGQIEIDLSGYIDSVNGGIRTSFKTVPDAPVSKFVLEMKGGSKSLLVNSTNLCKSTNRATVKMDGQNGKVHDFNPAVANSCGGKGKKK